MQQHPTELDRAWQAVVGKAMHEVYLYELEMYLAKVEAEAIERELKEALKQQEELQKKKKKKAKAQRESLARLAIQDPGEWKVWSEAKQQERLKEAQIEATSHHQPQPAP